MNTDAPDNVVEFPGATIADIPPKKILAKLIEADPEEIVAITRGKDDKIHVHTSSGYRPDILWLIENAKMMTMEPDEE